MSVTGSTPATRIIAVPIAPVGAPVQELSLQFLLPSSTGSVDGLKRLASRSTWWHKLPYKSTHAVKAAGGEASQGPTLAWASIRRKAGWCIILTRFNRPVEDSIRMATASASDTSQSA